MSLMTPTTAASPQPAVQTGPQPASGSSVSTVGTSGVANMWNSTIGAKLIVAVTGCLLLLFVIGHMIGNLQVFLGQDALNAYAVKLRAIPALLWAVRGGLLVIALLHVIMTVRLTLQNNEARPQDYRQKQPLKSTFSSRTMIWTGLLVLAFVIYHLMHFTWRVTNPEFASLPLYEGHFDVYAMVVLSFQNVYISAAYIIAMILLWFHLSHGIASMFQTAGWNTPQSQPFFERLALVVATIIVAGNISIPLFILLGVVKLPAGGM